MYLLDTNVLSVLDPRREPGLEPLVDWIARSGRALFLSVVTVMEMERGVLKMERRGVTRRSVELRHLSRAILASFSDRVLPVTVEVALETARMGETTRALQIGTPDLLIAATARVHGLTVLTRNLRHFRPTGVPAIDPFERLPPDA